MEELTEEGCLAGISPLEVEEWTWGEAAAAVRAYRRRERLRGQALSLIAARAAGRGARGLAGGGLGRGDGGFPFGEGGEVRALRVEHYRQIMQRHAASARAGREEV